METKKKRIDTRSMVVIVVLSFAYSLIYAVPFMRGILYDTLIDGLSLSNVQLGMLLTVYGVSCLVLGPIGGLIVDKVGIKLSTVLSLVLSAALCCWYSTLPSYFSCLVIFALFGLTTQVVFYPAYNKAQLLGGDKEVQGKIYGWGASIRSLGTILFNSLMVALFASFAAPQLGIKNVLLIFAGLHIVMAVIILILMKPSPKGDNKMNVTEKVSAKDYINVLKIPEVWLVGAMMFFAYWGYMGTSYFTPYATNVLNLEIATVGFIMTYLTGVSKFIVGPICGVIVDKMKSSIKFLFFSGIIGGVALFVLSLLSPGLPIWVPLAILFVGLFMSFAAYSLGFVGITETAVPEKLYGTAMGVIVTLTFLPDMFIYLLFGDILDKTGLDGFRTVFQISAGALVMVSVIAVVLILKIRKANSHRNEEK